MIVRIVEIVGYIPPPSALSPRGRVRTVGDNFCPKPVRNLRRVRQQRVDLINFNGGMGRRGGVWANLGGLNVWLSRRKVLPLQSQINTKLSFIIKIYF